MELKMGTEINYYRDLKHVEHTFIGHPGGNVKIFLSEEGYCHPESFQNWTMEIAKFMAMMDGLDLSKKEMVDGVDMSAGRIEVIEFLREYWGKYQIAPMIQILTKELAKKYGREKGSTKYLYELFPAGPAKQACRYAGLPKPTGCV